MSPPMTANGGTSRPSSPRTRSMSVTDPAWRRLLLWGRPLGGLIGRRKDPLIYRARLSNEPGSFQFRLRDKLYDFAHMCSEFYRGPAPSIANIVPFPNPFYYP